MTSDSRRLTLSILLASSLHAAVATSLLVAEPPKREPFPEGEYIELGAIEVPQGMQVIQPKVDPAKSKKVVAKPEVVKQTPVVSEPKPEVITKASDTLPDKTQDHSEVALQPEVEDAVDEVDEQSVNESDLVDKLAANENSEALAQEMLEEERKVLAEEKAKIMAQKQPQKPNVYPFL